MKTSWWTLTIDDYPNYKPNDIDLEHIAEMIKQGYDNGQLTQKYEATMYREAQPIYEFTTEEHGDIEYLYSFEFDRSMPKNVKVIVESCASWEDRKELINTEFSITPQNVEKHLKEIINAKMKLIKRVA